MLYIILMCISHVIFFDNDITCCIFIVDYGNDVKQKANYSDFLILVQNQP